MESDTIIGAEFEPQRPLRSMLHGADFAQTAYAEEPERRVFKIRTADTQGVRSSASVLINRMYATRGYKVSPLPDRQLPTRITLTAAEHDETVGTITIGFDSDAGLHVDELFLSQTHALRREGRKICEFTKLAMDSVVRSKRVLASLFHVAYLYAHRMMGFDDLLIEVNPRHVRYYHQMLGFEALGAPRHNPRVDAPAVLMRLELNHAYNEIERLAGREAGPQDRSLYPLFFAPREEAGIISRLKVAHPNEAFDQVDIAHAQEAQRRSQLARAMH